ncbi:B3 domain-containing protein Os07g0679700-like isoform X1 [Rutidosis leptorrhynchoides]|uniref:B3 domain-containing protein Os07g0679700-like isoform X1 n=2 Tax=Rutidosis leptorrhynchoides TaxID=125765 RepID=UPI003A9917C3
MTSEESSEHIQTDIQNAPSGSQQTPVMTTEAAIQAEYTMYPPPISGEPFQRYKPIYSDGITPPRANSPVTTTRLDFSSVDSRVILASTSGGTTGPHVVCCGQSISEDKADECGISVENSVGEVQSSSIIMLKRLSDNDDASTSQIEHEEFVPLKGDIQTNPTSTSTFNGSLVETDLTMGLASSSSPQMQQQQQQQQQYPIPQMQLSRHILPKVPKPILPQRFDPNANMNQIRVARPPVEGRIKNQLLPRYWPRITEQELQQISGESNSTIVPLFEKVLSASDAGRIGRLVLPKACAEAYFPPISQPEGIPLRIQDVKGKEWLFQFRFWPNNNSRMYVLEGVTPCIQSMQLKAGDTVTFSRMEPDGKLLIGSRKAVVNTPLQDPRMHTMGNVSNMSDYSNVLQSLKRNTDSHLDSLSRNMNLTIGDASWHAKSKVDSSFQPDKKRSRNIGSKSKRLLIESQDALDLKYTWEELQDMLLPPVTTQPSTVTIEEHEFEEYEEPPVFGKESIFTVQLSGEQEQWGQCDNCSKWRRLPADFILPAKWTCQDNIWDQSRAACLAPDELNPRELEQLLGMVKEFHKWKNSVGHGPNQEQGASGPNQTEPSTAATTKHPRHRPGCSCIVCSQPPSGKGKHKPNCTCNVCMTVKRRFKTLMLRKQQRQSEREAEIAEKNQLNFGLKNELQVNESRFLSKSQLDLNIHPLRVQDNNAAGTSHLSMMSLLQAANQPLETYMKQNGLTSLVSEQQASSGSQVFPQASSGCTPMVHEEELQGPDHNDNSS